MNCAHFEAARCRSCSWLEISYESQLERKAKLCRDFLGAVPRWDPPVASALAGFRNKAKLVIGGSVSQPVLGIIGPDGVVDLHDCALHELAIQQALPVLSDFITEAGLTPYDVAARQGELKYLLVTSAPTDELMVRFVLRSTEAEARIRKHLDSLCAALPSVAVVSLNIQPEHKAILEGDREIVLTESAELPMPINDVDLRLRPQSFFQTNTKVASALYRAAREFIAGVEVNTVWDLYCGVGGFAMHLAKPGMAITGVEISPEAVISAQAPAPGTVRFLAADAFSFAQQALAAGDSPDLVVVNPPRRGIGDLAALLEGSRIPAVLYSSCNAASLARDLAAMPSLRTVRAQVFDMFPHTSHYEVLTLLTRDLV